MTRERGFWGTEADARRGAGKVPQKGGLSRIVGPEEVAASPERLQGLPGRADRARLGRGGNPLGGRGLFTT